MNALNHVWWRKHPVSFCGFIDDFCHDFLWLASSHVLVKYTVFCLSPKHRLASSPSRKWIFGVGGGTVSAWGKPWAVQMLAGCTRAAGRDFGGSLSVTTPCSHCPMKAELAIIQLKSLHTGVMWRIKHPAQEIWDLPFDSTEHVPCLAFPLPVQGECSTGVGCFWVGSLRRKDIIPWITCGFAAGDWFPSPTCRAQAAA